MREMIRVEEEQSDQEAREWKDAIQETRKRMREPQPPQQPPGQPQPGQPAP